MSKSSQTRKFFHTASALAVGGFLTDPARDNISSETAATLSPLGGYGSAEGKDFKFKEIASFESATVEVIGNYDVKTDTHSNLSTCMIKGLNLLGVVTADSVVARMASSFSSKRPHHPLRVSVLGSHFVNLRIAGKLVDPQPVEQLSDETTCEEHLSSQLRQNDLKRSALFLSDYKHGEHIPDFGRVFIGEFLPNRRAARFAMLRFELGCAVQGEVSFAIVEGGGGEWPNQ